MAEKVIHEFRFIETEDGFRIEIKGDKERMRKMGFGPGMGKHFGCGGMFGMDFGPGMHFWRHKRPGHDRRGPGFGPPWTWWDWGEEDSEEEPEPPKDV